MIDLLLWGIYPYVAIAVLIAGTAWRARYDQFGWTSRSSQLHESRLLRLGSPLFHFGMLFVILGHVVGLVVPQSWTDKAGLSDHAYHLMALSTGAVAGLAALVGIAVLLYRRLSVPAVRRSTLRSDHVLYTVLIGAMLLGIGATMLSSVGATGDYNYREGISLWFRSLFTLSPDYHLMAQAPLVFKVHIVFGFALFALIPYSRLVHMFSAPVKYLFRPFVVYRSRARGRTANRRPRRGWERLT